MPSPVQEATADLRQGHNLGRERMRAVMDRLTGGAVPAEEIAAFLSALHDKGETVDELVGAAESLRGRMQSIGTRRSGVTDTCGTGGSGRNTFNISTAAALVAAAAGAVVAKHGNRRSTGSSGSSDVLAELGVDVEAPLAIVVRCLDELGICFCLAPLHHPSVRHVMDVRRSLPHPTVFNWLGPLCNPARAEYQLLGSGRPEKHRLLAEALAVLGVKRGLVVHSRDGLGEVSTGAVTDGWLVEGAELRGVELDGGQFGVPLAGLDQFRVSSPAESAAVIRGVLAGQQGPARDIVLVNAATVLWVCGVAEGPGEAMERVAAAVDSGRARRKLEDLAALSRTR